MKKHIYSLYNLSHNILEYPHDFKIADYSKFKYGDGHIAQKYAAKLAKLFNKELPKEQSYFLTGSAYEKTPTAAVSIAEYLHDYLSELGFDIDYRPLKTHAYAKDYSQMNLEERTKLIENNTLSIDPYVLKQKSRPLIVIDDIRITGLHEFAIEKYLSSKDLDEVIFGYVAILNSLSDNRGAQIEWDINHSYINSLERLVHIVNSNDFRPNARLCKFILGAKTAELEKFINKIPLHKLQSLVVLIRQDGYHLLDEYKLNYQLIESSLLKDKLRSLPKGNKFTVRSTPVNSRS